MGNAPHTLPLKNKHTFLHKVPKRSMMIVKIYWIITTLKKHFRTKMSMQLYSCVPTPHTNNPWDIYWIQPSSKETSVKWAYIIQKTRIKYTSLLITTPTSLSEELIDYIPNEIWNIFHSMRNRHRSFLFFFIAPSGSTFCFMACSCFLLNDTSQNNKTKDFQTLFRWYPGTGLVLSELESVHSHAK